MEINKDAWKNYRNRWVFLRGKKIKLRKYIYVSALLMRQYNKPGWQKVNHVRNYQNALSTYGFDGIQIYEDHFYKDIPLPEKRSFWIKLGLKLTPFYEKCSEFKNKVLKPLAARQLGNTRTTCNSHAGEQKRHQRPC